MTAATINVLLTGSTGFIGRHLRQRLLKDDRIRLFCVSPSISPAETTREVSVQSPLSRLSSTTWQKLGIEKFDLVFHLASFTPKASKDANDFEPIIESNIAGTASLVKSFAIAPTRIVFASTVDVYGHSQNVITDQSIAMPLGLHGLSKLFCERMLHVDSQRRNYELCILRYGHIYGPGEGAYKKIIPTFIRSAISGKPLIVACDGSTTRDFLYVEDAVEASIRAANCFLDAPSPINVVSGVSITLQEVAETIVRATGSNVEIIFKQSSAPQIIQFRNDAMLKNLGDFAFTPFGIGIKREVQWFQNEVLA